MSFVNYNESSFNGYGRDSSTYQRVDANVVAESILGNLLVCMNSTKEYIRAQEKHEWHNMRHNGAIFGSKILIIGGGRIGTTLGQKLQGLGAFVIGIKRQKCTECGFNEVYTYDYVDVILPKVDVVIITAPPVRNMMNFFNKDRLLLLRKDAIFMACSQGGLVDEEALAEIMNKGHLFAAAMDVFKKEPLDKDSRLWDIHNLLITPHASGDGYTINKYIENK